MGTQIWWRRAKRRLEEAMASSVAATCLVLLERGTKGEKESYGRSRRSKEKRKRSGAVGALISGEVPVAGVGQMTRQGRG